MNDFEKQWLKKMKTGFVEIKQENLYKKMITGKDDKTPSSWTKELMRKLLDNLSQKQVEALMCSCACLSPKNELQTLKDVYNKTRDIKLVHKMLQEYFEIMIIEYKNLNEKQLQYLRENSMGMAGKLENHTITATKIPKEFHKYRAEKNENKKKYYYCHCPRIRETLLTENDRIDPTYCYCGAGFYKDIWEFILQKPVVVEVIESVLKGDEFCKIRIKYRWLKWN